MNDTQVQLTHAQGFERLKQLFSDYQDKFGLAEHDDLEAQCDFEEKFQKIVCLVEGHDFVLDQCGFEEHMFCYKCGRALYPELMKMKCSEITGLKKSDKATYDRLHVKTPVFEASDTKEST